MYQIDIAQLAALIRERRGRRSLRAAAAEIGISAATLSRLERSAPTLDLLTFLDACAWLHVHPADLITDTAAGAILPPPSLAESAAYALAPLAPAVREALLLIIEALARAQVTPPAGREDAG